MKRLLVPRRSRYLSGRHINSQGFLGLKLVLPSPQPQGIVYCIASEHCPPLKSHPVLQLQLWKISQSINLLKVQNEKVCFQGRITCTEILGVLNIDSRTLGHHADKHFFFYHLGIADFGEKPNIIIDSSRALGRAKYLGRFFPVSQFVLSCLLNCHSWHGWLSEGMYSGMHSEGML